MRDCVVKCVLVHVPACPPCVFVCVCVLRLSINYIMIEISPPQSVEEQNTLRAKHDGFILVQENEQIPANGETRSPADA